VNHYKSVYVTAECKVVELAYVTHNASTEHTTPIVLSEATEVIVTVPTRKSYCRQATTCQFNRNPSDQILAEVLTASVAKQLIINTTTVWRHRMMTETA